jgi:hypothetical protein
MNNRGPYYRMVLSQMGGYGNNIPSSLINREEDIAHSP